MCWIVNPLVAWILLVLGAAIGYTLHALLSQSRDCSREQCSLRIHW